MDEPQRGRAPLRFILLYALAWAGGSIAYTPFLSILLPVRIAALAGPEAQVSWLAYLAFTGAIAASLGNILFGYLSDITRFRRGWVALGLALSGALLVLSGKAQSLTELIAAIAAWQLALNMMLAPLAAWAGDRVDDAHKGLLGGFLAFAPGLGALSGTLVTVPGLANPATRLILVVLLVCLFVMPVVLFERGDHPVPKPATTVTTQAARQAVLVRMWLARLAVQIAEAAMFSYLYFWFRTLDPAMDDNHTTRVFSAVLILSAPAALFAGRWIDRSGRPMTPLVLCAALSAGGLLTMAAAGSLIVAIAGYGLFGLASGVFLALHAAQTLRVLPRPERRGRDLGLFNLTNTVPSLVMPWMTLLIVPVFGYAGLFVLLALLAAIAAVLLAATAKTHQLPA
jgi:MFS family permease